MADFQVHPSQITTSVTFKLQSEESAKCKSTTAMVTAESQRSSSRIPE